VEEMVNSVVKGNCQFNSDIIATSKEFFPKDLGPEKRNLSYSNCTVRLETNGQGLPKKWWTEVIIISKIISIPS
jgi:hypothetical protein